MRSSEPGRRTGRPEGPEQPGRPGSPARSRRCGAPPHALPRRERIGRALVPYAYLSPTILLLVVLMVVPIVMVIGYSLMDGVITAQ